MGMLNLQSSIVLAIALAGLRSGVASDSIVSAKDRAVATKALAKSVEYCGDLEKLELPENAKEDLKAASGNNWALEQMKGAKDYDELMENMQNNIDLAFIIEKGGPIVASLLFLFSYCICCWSACPCCKCCRCRKGKHDIGWKIKTSGLLLLVGVVGGIIASAGMSQTGFNQAVKGFKHTSCTGSKLLNSTLSGHPSPPFLGLIPTLDVFDALISSLSPTSQFMQDLEAVITETKPIEDAVTLASGTMDLLKGMVASSANQRPKTSANVDLLHKCTLCPTLESALTPAIKSLNEGVGVQLKGARAEVKGQLTGTSGLDLASTVKVATSPLSELLTLMRTTFGPIVESNTMLDMTDLIDKFGLYCCLAMVLLALLISCCACSGMGLWTFRDVKTSTEEVNIGEKPMMKKQTSRLEDAAGKLGTFSSNHRSSVHRCALCTWCCGCFYVFFAFLVGGLLTAFSVPLASVCLILDDVNSRMLDDISGVLPTNFTGDAGDILKTTIDKCYRNPDKTANPYLLDIIFTRNATSNEKVTLRKTIVNDTRDMITAQFDKITQSMSLGSASMNTNAGIVQLKNTLANTRMDAMMVPDATYDFAGSVYSEMALDSRSPDGVATYWASSAACADFVVPADMGTLSGKTVKGTTSFSTSLSHFGATVSHVSCGKKVTCSAAAGTASGKACRASNLFMKLKQDLRTTNTFKCRSFKDSGGATCDVKDMVESPAGSGTYLNDCLKADGTLEVKEYDCTLAEFTTMITQFSSRLDGVFARLDKSVSATSSRINVDMKGLVDQTVIKRIERIADGLTCGFMGQLYQAFIDGTCYSGVWGLTQISTSYVYCAVFALILVLMMYTVWRLSVDNYNNSRQVVSDASGP